MVGTYVANVLNNPSITTILAAEGASTKRKKEGKVDASSSSRSPKRSHNGKASGSFASSFLDEDLCLGYKISYHLGSDVNDLLKGISGSETLWTTSELSFRLSVLTAWFPMVDKS